MPPTPPPNQWVAFFPFNGFHLQDEPNMLDAPLFGDATLVSYETLLRAFPQIRGIDKADAYIAVWRDGVVNTEWFGEDRKNDIFMANVQRRVSQIAALHSVSFLAMSTDGYLTALDNSFLHNETHFALIKYPLDSPGFVSSSSGPVVDTFRYSESETLSLSKTELRAFLEYPLLQNLVHAVSAQKSKLSRSLRQSIVQSCLRLANAFYEPSLRSFKSKLVFSSPVNNISILVIPPNN